MIIVLFFFIKKNVFVFVVFFLLLKSKYNEKKICIKCSEEKIEIFCDFLFFKIC